MAALVSSGTVEHALGREAGSLSWGPSLFRVLLAVHGLLLIVVRPAASGCRFAWPSKAVWLPLAMLSVAALGLRIYRLDSCLWFDEVLTLLDFARPPFALIFTSFPNQNQHMLYSLLAHASLAALGESAWALRLPAVLFGIASLWALYGLGRRLAGHRAALAACALMGVSYHHIWFSQDARGYTGLLFAATLATWLYVEALERRRWGWWLAYSFALFVGLWVHMTAAFVAAAHVLVYAVMRARGSRLETDARWMPLAAWTLCGSLTLQVYALALPEFFRHALREVSLPSEWLNPLWVAGEIWRGLAIGWAGSAVALAALALAGAGYLRILRRDWRAAVLMVLPAVLGGATMLLLAHNLWPRFFFFSMGFALLIAVEGALALPRLVLSGRPRLAAAAGAACLAVMTVASAATVPRCYRLPKQDFTGARDFVERSRSRVEPAVAVGLAGRAYGEYFAPQWRSANTRAELDQIRQTVPGLWLVYTLPIEVKAYRPDIWESIQSSFETVRVFPGTLSGGEVYVCRERSAASAVVHTERTRAGAPGAQTAGGPAHRGAVTLRHAPGEPVAQAGARPAGCAPAIQLTRRD
jgi:4-amino-4-deoxy-L-arabinose transferase-like glycosyltransferase